MGDFNGQIGTYTPEEKATLGPYSYNDKPRSKNGNKIVNFAQANNLTILNTKYKKNKKNMWTWLSPDGKSKNQIDFIMSNKTYYFSNFSVINNLNFNTNHRLVRAELKTNQSKNPRPRPNLRSLNCCDHQLAEITQNLKDKFRNYKHSTTNMGTQDKYNYIEKLILDVVSNYSKHMDKTKSWLSTKTINLLTEREKTISANKTEKRRTEIANISKEIKLSMKKDRKQKRMDTIEKHVIKSGGIKKAYKELTNTKDWIVKIKNRKGESDCRRENILEVATAYYKELFEINTAEAEVELTDNADIPTILLTEVEHAIDMLRKEKALGPDGISNDVIKGTKSVLAPVFTDLFNYIIRTEIIPQQWTKSNIVLLYKKGDQFNIGNYRPISLVSNIYKLFAKIILKRIEQTLDEQQPIEQAGFRKNFSVIDHIHVVRQILEKCTEYKLTYYLAFVDYSKAFDSLLHKNIWESLKAQGVEQKYIRLIRNVYEHSTACIQLERKGAHFRIQRGVRQGDPLSPILFSAVLETIFRGFDWKDQGINIDGRKLTHLRFADDIVLISKTPQDLQGMLNDIARESRKVGLKLNPEKTKLITNGVKDPIKVGDTDITYSNEYVYLGQLISPDDNIIKEIERRIASGWRRYWNMKEIMKDKTLPLSIKGKLFNTSILPILTYGRQTWPSTELIKNKLKSCQLAMERSMHGVRKSDKIRSHTIRCRTKANDVVLCIKRLKWRWAGHTIRGKDKWSKLVTQWYPREGKRKKGRPPRRWEDDIRQVAGKTWHRVASNRREWKRLEEAFANWQTDLQTVSKSQIVQTK